MGRFETLCWRLRRNETCSEDVRGWKIGPAQAVALSSALKENSSLQELDMQINLIGPEGAAALADGLAQQSTLQTLNLYGNGIGPIGAARLAAALRTNHGLTSLSLCDNKLDEKAIESLASAMAENITLTSLAVGDNPGSRGRAAEALTRELLANTDSAKREAKARRIGRPALVVTPLHGSSAMSCAAVPLAPALASRRDLGEPPKVDRLAELLAENAALKLDLAESNAARERERAGWLQALRLAASPLKPGLEVHEEQSVRTVSDDGAGNLPAVVPATPALASGYVIHGGSPFGAGEGLHARGVGALQGVVGPLVQKGLLSRTAWLRFMAAASATPSMFCHHSSVLDAALDDAERADYIDYVVTGLGV